MSKTGVLRVAEIVEKLGIAREEQLVAAGVNPKIIDKARSRGVIERLERGTYAVPGFMSRLHAPLLFACTRVPCGVICLRSAAYFHGLLPQPSQVWLAIDHKARLPTVQIFELEVVRFSGDALTQGVVNRRLGNRPIRVYSPMKTIADLLKCRGRLGIDVAIEVLRASIETKQYSPYRLLHFARICRVERLVKALIQQYGSGRKFEGQQIRSAWRDRAL